MHIEHSSMAGKCPELHTIMLKHSIWSVQGRILKAGMMRNSQWSNDNKYMYVYVGYIIAWMSTEFTQLRSKGRVVQHHGSRL